MFEEHTTPLERQIMRDKEREMKALNEKKKKLNIVISSHVFK